MKKQIHPLSYIVKTECSCGQIFEVTSTKSQPLRLEVCNACHPFFTGKHRIVDTGGRVDRFKQRFKGLASTFKE